MQKLLRNLSWLVAALILAASLAACDNNDDDDATPAATTTNVTVTGTVATGQIVANNEVTIKDANGVAYQTASLKTDANGVYSFTGDLAFPLWIKVTPVINGVTAPDLYSVVAAAGADNKATANVTPLTTLVADLAAQKSGAANRASTVFTSRSVTASADAIAEAGSKVSQIASALLAGSKPTLENLVTGAWSKQQPQEALIKSLNFQLDNTGRVAILDKTDTVLATTTPTTTAATLTAPAGVTAPDCKAIAEAAYADVKTQTTPGKLAAAKNVILIIGDGMNLQHEIAGSRYLYGSDFGLSFHQFPFQSAVATWDVTTWDRFGYQLSPARSYDAGKFSAVTDAVIGFSAAKGGDKPLGRWPSALTADEKKARDAYYLTALATGSLSAKAPATDSASAGTAMSCGVKTDDGNIAWKTKDPDDGKLTTIAELMRSKKNASIGVVSTVPFNHATPAAFVSHNKSRNNYEAIGLEIAQTVKPEVVIGAGYGSASYYSAALQTAVKGATDYVVVERASGVSGATALAAAADQAVTAKKKLFGVFGNAGGQFDYHVPADAPGAPKLTQGSTENPLLKDASLAALKLLSQDADGFFLMIEQGDIDWANHSNLFPQMIGGMWDLDEAVKAVVEFVNKPGDSIDWSNTLLIVTADHSNSHMRLQTALPKGDLPASDRVKTGVTADQCPSCLTMGATSDVTYSSGDHVNEPVMLYAKGDAADLFAKYQGTWYPGTKLLDNTQIFTVMKEAAQIN